MKVDVSFFNARVFDVSRIDVITGQIFGLDTDFPGDCLWFSDNDPVLEINVTAGSSATLKALKEGVCTLLLMAPDRKILKEITINVVAQILPPADTLAATTGTPVSK